MRNLTPALVSAILLAAPFVGFSALAQAAPTAAPSYALSVFVTAPAGSSAPDSIAVLDGHVFVGYGDGHKPDGSDGLSSQIVEYKMDGTTVHVYTVVGHNDGLKVNPWTHELWALQNEDSHPNLVIIDPRNERMLSYSFGPTPHGGGYDDMVFAQCRVYISASNPANNPNTGPAIVEAHLDHGFVLVKPVLSGGAQADDLVTGQKVQLNLQDPDSMTRDAWHDLVLDSQADHELIVVAHAGTARQTVLRLPLSYTGPSGPVSVEVDDTAFATSSQGFILFADKGLNTVYKLTRAVFSPGAAYTSADGGPFVGALDMTSGIITPVVTGLSGPGGLVFVNTSPLSTEPEAHPAGDRSCRHDGHEPAPFGWNHQ
jgi:hypothetical protein